jgi:hypothetical protein
VQESYGRLDQLPIVGFLQIDTDPNRAIALPSMAGDPLTDGEHHWATVNFETAKQITTSPDEYPWFHQWLPTELMHRPEYLTSEQGTSGVRAAGRLAFFCHYEAIRTKVLATCNRLHQSDRFMVDEYGLMVANALNIFLVTSIGGGTGSGMWIDLAYSLREWLNHEPWNPETQVSITAIATYPDSLSDTHLEDQLKANSYAALMELNYYSDADTRYSIFYRATETQSYRIESWRSPFDYTYLVGASNRPGIGLKLETIREMMAQHLFLDLVSDYAPYKQHLRQSIQASIGQQLDTPPQGRTYPRNFMSFGIATIEIPVHQIRTSLTARLAADVYRWWLNVDSPLSGSDIRQSVVAELQAMQLFGKDLHLTLCQTEDGRSLVQILQQWVQDLAVGMTDGQRLLCTAQMPSLPIFAKETGNILHFLDQYLFPRVQQFQQGYLESEGYFCRQMRLQRDRLVSQLTAMLQEQIYSDLTDRHQGAKSLQYRLKLIEDLLAQELTRHEADAATWADIQTAGRETYRAACQEIQLNQTNWIPQKTEWMTQQANRAIAALGKAFQAELERKCRAIAMELIQQLQRVVGQLKWQLNHWLRRIAQSEVNHREASDEEANVNVLELVGLKLFQRQELERLYADFLNMNLGSDTLCQLITAEVLQHSQTHAFWDQTQPFRLLDIEKLAEADYPAFEAIVHQVTQRYVEQAPQLSKLYLERDACARFAKLYPDEQSQQTQISLLYNCSRPLIHIDRQALMGRFDCVELAQVAILGGADTPDPIAKQQVAILRKYFKGDQYFPENRAIAPLSSRDRHKIFAVHEIGGFSLRCISGMDVLRQAYQQWHSQKIAAERSQDSGRSLPAPIPIHVQNEVLFWDFMPADPAIERLVVIARALDILWEEFSQTIQKNAIHYLQSAGGDLPQRIVLASSWEEVVQILELEECEGDRTCIQAQIDARLQAVNHDPEGESLRLQLRQKLETYLQQIFPQDWDKSTDQHPLFLRHRAIVDKFMVASRL